MLQQVRRRTDAGEQQLRSQAGDEGAVAAANVQYTGSDQGSNRLADGAAAGAERLGQLGFRRQSLAGDQLASGDEVAHLFDRGLGQRCCHVDSPPRTNPHRRLDIGCLMAYSTSRRRIRRRKGNRTGGDAMMTNLASVGGTDAGVGADPPPIDAGSTVSPAAPDEPRGPSDERQQRRFRLLRVALGVIRLGPVLILAGLVLAMTLLSPVFFTTGNAGNVLAQTAAIAVLAIGQLLVILTRGIDLSVGSTLALASVVGAIAFSHGNSAVVVIAVMLGAGAAVGFVNGAVYVWGRLPHPFIITLATLSIARGLALQFSGGQPKRGVPVDREDHRQFIVPLGAVLGVPRRRHRPAGGRCPGAPGVGTLDLRDGREPRGRPTHRHSGSFGAHLGVRPVRPAGRRRRDHHLWSAQRRLADIGQPRRARLDRRGDHRRCQLPRRPWQRRATHWSVR